MFSAIGKAVVATLFIAIFSVYNGWAFSLLWLWFVVPLGVMPLGVFHASGLILLPAFCLKMVTKEEDTLKTLGISIISPICMVGIGFILHLFM